MGIDVSKGYADFLVLNTDKKAKDAGFQLDDTADGHKKLSEYLQNFFASHPDAILYAAVESTGGYENNWYNRMKLCGQSFPIHIARINPAWVKSNSEASAQRNKTDAISARDIALYQIEHPEKIVYDEEDYPSLRRQWTLIKMYVKQRKQLLNQLESQLYGSMPELLTFCSQGVPNWLLKLLTHYPSYQEVLHAGVTGLSQISYVSTQKAQQVLTLVKEGIGMSDQVTAQILKSLATQILHAGKLIEQQKQFLEKNYQEAKHETELLLTIKGIGVYSAVGLLLNIGDIHRFPTAKHLACYFGLHPVYKKSGDGTWGMHMSKQGRSEPRAILYMVAFSAIQHNPIIKRLYARCLAKRMHRSSAIGVCMHKTLRIIYGILKNNIPFDPNIDRQNREKLHPHNQKRVTKSIRRFQQFDKNAPISKRQQKKRKEQTQSQDEKTVVYGISEPAPS
ncbi:MAG: IS110 family RNA-guided transposase [Planctomycetota bacterium]|jgi:transposase